jgi:hypothetical protein
MSAGVAQAVQPCKQLLSETNYVGSSPTSGIFLYVALAVERVLAESVGNKLSWFESLYRQIYCVKEAVEYSLRVALRN